MAIVHQSTFTCTDLSGYLVTDNPGGTPPGNLIEVSRMAGITPGPPDLLAATYREQVQFTHMRVQQFVLGRMYKITVEDA